MAVHNLKPIDLASEKGKKENKKKFDEEVAKAKKEGKFVSAKEAVKRNNKKITKGKKINTLAPIDLGSKQGIASKALDVISAPLSQTKTTLTKGIGAGAEAVKKSRERIESGDTVEVGRTIGRTLLSTAAAAGGVLVGGEIVAAGGVSEAAAGIGASLSRTLPSGIIKGIGATRTAVTSKAAKSLVKKGAVGLAGGSGMMTWLASDNIISSMNIFTRDLRDAVTFGQMSPDEALEKLNEGQQFVNKAKSFINTNTALNPLLWAFRGIIISNVDAAQLVLDNNRESIIRAGEKQEGLNTEVSKETDGRE